MFLLLYFLNPHFFKYFFFSISTPWFLKITIIICQCPIKIFKIQEKKILGLTFYPCIVLGGAKGAERNDADDDKNDKFLTDSFYCHGCQLFFLFYWKLFFPLLQDLKIQTDLLNDLSIYTIFSSRGGCSDGSNPPKKMNSEVKPKFKPTLAPSKNFESFRAFWNLFISKVCH